jgi:hypothetical protein
MRAVLLVSCFFLTLLGCNSPARGESLLAGGVVAPDGTLESSFNLVFGEITSVRTSPGTYTLTLSKTNRFAGATFSDFFAETTIRSDQPGDTLASGIITDVSNDSVTVEVKIRDAEVAVPPFGGGAPSDDKFNFLLRRVDPGSIAVEPESRFLIMAASIAGDISLPTVTPDGSEILTERLGEGDYRVRIVRTGGFADDASDDYLLLLSPLSFNGLNSNADESVRGEVEDVSHPDSVTFRIRTDDLHASPDPSDQSTPSDQLFSMAVYRVKSDQFNARPDSSRIAGLVLHGGGTDVKQSVFPNGVVHVTQTGVGSYEVGFHSVNAFGEGSELRYLPFVYDSDGNASSKLLISQVLAENPNSLSVEVKAYNVETSRGSGGTSVNARFGLVLYDTQANSRVDGTIGPHVTKQIGQGIVNSTGFQQTLFSRVPRSGVIRFVFSVTNDGNSTEELRIGQRFSRSDRTSFSRISGSRTDVTALIRSGATVSNDFRPRERMFFAAISKTRKLIKRRSLGTIHVRAGGNETTSDTLKISILP